ncbi:MAG: GDYXXLXY domain-containing protein [Elusimicrobiaceae bacterium]|nr:GDYXXLXY domain-containing protein [Elusimicrobiaceae bacterium]
MKNKLLALSFAIPFLCLLAWTLHLTWQRSHGLEITVPVTGYDPRDLLSGHYIQYEIDWAQADCTQFPGGKCLRENFCKKARWGRQCRFYIPETDAKRLDNLFRKRNNETLKFEVVYSYTPGQPAIAKQLLINSQDWREYIMP